MLHHYFEHQCLCLSVLWDDTTPVAALAGCIDQVKKTFYAYIVGYNPEYAKLSPGRVMFGYSIQYAIENGFQIYDFLRGVEQYKLSLGSKKHFVTYTTIIRKGLRSTVANNGLNLTRRLRDLLKKKPH